MTNNKSYSHMLRYNTFEERFNYLKIFGCVGKETFGSKRYLNQKFYTSKEWRMCRNAVIIRDDCCDLGISDRPIYGKVLIHHINPITEDILRHSDNLLFDLENLVTVSVNTHNALHYGDETLLFSSEPVSRKPYDTIPWKD